MIDKAQLLAWLGSDATKDDLIDLLLEIANDKYLPADLRGDINAYEGESNETN
jgi:hypothetical protein